MVIRKTLCAILLLTGCLTLAAQQPAVTITCPDGAPITTAQGNSLSVRCPVKPTPTPVPVVPTPGSTPTPAIAPVGIFVSPTGKSTGTGEAGNPLDLATAISSRPPVKPGQTVYLRGGTYAGAFVSSLNGTATQPVVIRPYPGEKVKLDCTAGQTASNVELQGSNVIWRDFEVTCTGADRTKPFGAAFTVYAPGAKIINCLIHNTGGGIYAWSPSIDFEAYGNIIARVGYQGAPPDRGRGHAIYAQNNEGTKRVIDNVLFDPYSYPLHIYSEGGSLKGFHIEGDIIFGGGASARQPEYNPNILIGGFVPADRITLKSVYTYHPINMGVTNVQVHYGTKGNGTLVAEDCYFIGGTEVLSLREWISVLIKGSTFAGTQRLVTIQQPSGSTYSLNSNNYLSLAPQPTPFGFWKDSNNAIAINWAAFRQQSGFESTGNWAQAGLPVKVLIRPNRFETGRAHIAIYNLGKAASVRIDLAGVLSNGDAYQLFDVRNLNAPVMAGTYQGAFNLPIVAEFAAYLLRKN